MRNRTHFTAVLVGALLALVLAACGSSNHATVGPAARLIHLPGSSADKIVLTAVGAPRIGLATATAHTATAKAKSDRNHHKRTRRASAVVIPASAVVYDPSGKTYVFVSVGRLAFAEVPVVVNYMNGNAAYLRSGPRAGAQVVSHGAEELYGVQTGVLGQT